MNKHSRKSTRAHRRPLDREPAETLERLRSLTAFMPRTADILAALADALSGDRFHDVRICTGAVGFIAAVREAHDVRTVRATGTARDRRKRRSKRTR